LSIQFHFARIPEIIFGSGSIAQLPAQIKRFGEKILLIIDVNAMQSSGILDTIINDLKENRIVFQQKTVSGEPSPSLIDQLTAGLQNQAVQTIVAVGGGSVVDTGKAVSAMAGRHESVYDYLEGVGTKLHDGKKLPFIAVPTTAGTGSEATKNAVLSQTGEKGFKKSIRHENFVPDVALVDPRLSLSCPASVTAACGMDAFTQLLESYVSDNSSPLTDALAYDGLRVLKDQLVPAVTEGAHNLTAREAMSYAALLSGITLANAGLGIVHGLASPMGGYTNIPHGVACGTLVAAATRMTIEKLQEDPETNKNYIEKYARIGRLFSADKCRSVDECCDFLIAKLQEWTDALHLPRLDKYGFDEQLIGKIAAETGNKNNPVKFTETEIIKILRERM
jgi:alcohol dehydrogenase class IV